MNTNTPRTAVKRIAPTLIAIALVLIAIAIIQTPTGHVTAQGGQVTQTEITPGITWGAIYGSLSPQGKQEITITKATIRKIPIHHNGECTKTQIIASPNTTALSTLTPITPADADTLLANDPNNPYSITNTYTQQRTYEVAGQNHELWSTETKSPLQTYWQAIATDGTQLVHITNNKRVGRAYNNESATYQLMLPAGTYQLTTDNDTCVEFNETEELSTTTTTLQAAVPTRVCTQEQTTMYAVNATERTLCRPEDVPEGCLPLEDVQAQITQDGNLWHEHTTEETGEILFTPPLTGTYTLELTYNQQRANTQFRSAECGQNTTTQEQVITQERNTVESTNLFEDSQLQEPAPPQRQQNTLPPIPLLTGSALLILTGLWAHIHANDSALILRIRILWQQIKQQLL